MKPPIIRLQSVNLHYAAVATGTPIRQVRDVAAYWWSMTIASNRGLWDGTGTANDAIAAPTAQAWLSSGRRRSPVSS